MSSIPSPLSAPPPSNGPSSDRGAPPPLLSVPPPLNGPSSSHGVAPSPLRSVAPRLNGPSSSNGGAPLTPVPSASNGTSIPGGGSSSGIGTAAIAGIAIAVGFIGAFVLVVIIWVWLAKKNPKWRLRSILGFLGSYNSMKDLQSHAMSDPSPPITPNWAGPRGKPNGKSVSQNPEVGKAFTYQDLRQATNEFSPSNLLGEGGFGRVYKANIAGNLVAVKQLKLGSRQGEREFRAEVEIISRVHHRHLVSLVGYCISDHHRLLVYKYVPNGTLEHALHGSGKPCMDWATRMNIALGTARGLAYLHEDCHPRIIHRDIKGSNILLDEKWEAQVSDFGLAKLADDAQTHVTTRVMGTFGYVAPEYVMSGKLTDKSDVYSFGVILLELITGKKPVDTTLHAADGEESLVEWARPLLTEALETGNVDAVVDPNLNNKYDKEEMFRMVEVAATCVRHSFQKRPKMVEALRSLTSQVGDLHQGVLPGYSSNFAEDDMRKFRHMAFSTSTSKSSSNYKGVSRSDALIPSAFSSKSGSIQEHSALESPILLVSGDEVV